MRDLVKLHIDGIWRDGERDQQIDIIDPATEKIIGRVAMASTRDVEDALTAAQRGFFAWRDLAVAERSKMIAQIGQLLRTRVDVISRDLTLEQGKTLAQARGEVLATADYFTDLAQITTQVFGRIVPHGGQGVTRSVTYEPIGPIFAVSPWNLPAMMPGRKIANSLAAGCSIIVKPAKETPITAAAIAQCCADAGVPPGVVNVVTGDSSRLSTLIIASPIIRKVSFTGSTDIGKQLAQLAGAHMKKTTMELGGHAPVIVMDDVDVPAVVEAAVIARYSNAGQSCIAPTRFFVHESIYQNFAALFTERVRDLRVGNGLDPQVQMGPLVSARRVLFMNELVSDAVQKGAKLLAGGARIGAVGHFFAPTVLAGVTDAAAIMTQEPFGPVTPVVAFRDVEAVIARANETPYGLAAYVFSSDLELAARMVARIGAGMVGINSFSAAHPSVPFGGVKDSGIGREGTLDGVLESLVTKSISVGHCGRAQKPDRVSNPVTKSLSA